MTIERKEIDLRTFFAEKQDVANLKPGISNIALLNVNGKTKTYRITLTDNTHFDFSIADGADGSKGATGATGKGITKIQKTSTSGLVDTYTITYSDNTTTTFTVTNGANGSNANVDLSNYATSSDLDDLQTYLEGLISGIEEDMLE